MKLRISTLMLAGLVCATRQFALADGGGDCPLETAEKQLPQLVYQVGSQATTCAKSAAEISQKEGKPIQFVVKQTYDQKSAAIVALAEMTETLVQQFATPTACQVSGKVAVGGEELTCSKKATAKAALIKKAINAVKVSYKVGDKECDCPLESKKLAAETKANVVYRVEGKETTCPYQHRLNAARAKYRAAVAAVAKVAAAD